MGLDRSSSAWLARIADDAGGTEIWHRSDTCPSCRSGDDLLTARVAVAGVPAALIVTGCEGSRPPTLTAHVLTGLAAAFDRAREEQLPVVAVAASGGVDLRHGTPAFVGMVDVVAAVARHGAAGLAYLCYLTHPTTGGTLASWAGAASLRAAEPGALIAFAGPRVVELTTGTALDMTVCAAESRVAQGLVDAVVEPVDLRRYVARVLLATSVPDTPEAVPTLDELPPTSAPVDAWSAILRTRRPDRPGLRQLLDHVDDRIDLRGGDPSVVAAIGRLRGRRVALVGHDRCAGPDRATVTPGGLAAAHEAVHLAERLRLPVVSVVDTPGARLDDDAERGGIAFAIARSITARASRRVPMVSVLLGEGGGGAALAFVPADRVLAVESAWLAPLPPEGSSAVLHRSTERAAECAATQHLTSSDLRDAGTVHHVVPETGDWIASVADAVAATLTELAAAPGRNLAAAAGQ